MSKMSERCRGRKKERISHGQLVTQTHSEAPRKSGIEEMRCVWRQLVDDRVNWYERMTLSSLTWRLGVGSRPAVDTWKSALGQSGLGPRGEKIATLSRGLRRHSRKLTELVSGPFVKFRGQARNCSKGDCDWEADGCTTEKPWESVPMLTKPTMFRLYVFVFKGGFL